MSEQYKPLHEAHTEIKVGGERIDLTYDNTTLYEFGHGNEQMNHTYVRLMAEKAIFIYGNPELYELLKEKEYPRVFSPEPSEAETNSYVGYQAGNIDDDLRELQENE